MFNLNSTDPKGYMNIMPESSTNTAASVAEKAIVNRAAKAAATSAAEVSKTLPTVVETTELAMKVPTKVVMNQKLVVIAVAVGGAVVGAGALYGVNKFRGYLLAKKLDKDLAVEEQ